MSKKHNEKNVLLKNTKEKKKTILGVIKSNLVIYIFGLIVSMIFIAISFIFSAENNWRAILDGIGASGIGAVFLGYFIELSNIKHANMIKNEIRMQKLSMLAFSTKHTLKRVAYWYFRMSFEVFNETGKDECCNITYAELWEELNKQSEAWGEYFYSETKTTDVTLGIKASKFYAALSNEIKQLSETIKNTSAAIQPFEVNGYFSGEDITNLNAAALMANHVLHNEYYLDSESVKSFFEFVLNIKELSSLKESELYYMKNKTAIVAKTGFLFESGIKKEDAINATSVNQRNFKYVIK